MAKIAVLILNYNSQTYLKNCLQSLRNQTETNIDIYLIDNHSSDKSVSFVSANFPEVKLIKHPKNYGVGKGFNLVIKKLLDKYEYFLLLNPDISLTKNAIKSLHQVFKKNKNIDIVAANIIYQQNKLIDTMGGKFINPFMGIFGGQFGGDNFTKIPNYYKKNIFPVFFGVITGMLVRKNIFLKHGFFDEDFFMYFEDIDLCWRIHLGKGRIVACPKAIIYHVGHGSIKTNKMQKYVLKITETNLLLTYYKNLSSTSLLIILPILLISRIIMSLLYLPISPQFTFGKLFGLAKFIKLVIVGKYKTKRKSSQDIRRVSDWYLFKNYFFSKISLNYIIKTPISWFSNINKLKRG